MLQITSAQLLQLLLAYRYVLVVPIAFVEGPIVSIVCGMLVHMGIMDLLPAYILLMLGDLIGDVFWYGIGYYWGHPFIKRFGHFFGVSEQNVETVKNIFNKYHERILFISKISMGLGFALATLITAGMSKIDFKRYIVINMIGQFIWTALLLAIGYEFGQLYTQIANGLGRVFLVGALIGLGIAALGFGRYVKDRLTKEIK